MKEITIEQMNNNQLELAKKQQVKPVFSNVLVFDEFGKRLNQTVVERKTELNEKTKVTGVNLDTDLLA